MEIENRWMESTLDSTMSRDERRQLAVGFVDLVLGKMAERKLINYYTPIDKNTYPKTVCPFVPDFSVSFERKWFSLFVAVDRDEFVQMGKYLDYDSSVLRIFEGDRVMDPRDIVSVLKRKLARANLVRRKVKKLVENSRDS